MLLSLPHPDPLQTLQTPLPGKQRCLAAFKERPWPHKHMSDQTGHHSLRHSPALSRLLPNHPSRCSTSNLWPLPSGRDGLRRRHGVRNATLGCASMKERSQQHSGKRTGFRVRVTCQYPEKGIKPVRLSKHREKGQEEEHLLGDGKPLCLCSRSGGQHRRAAPRVLTESLWTPPRAGCVC